MADVARYTKIKKLKSGDFRIRFIDDDGDEYFKMDLDKDYYMSFVDFLIDRALEEYDEFEKEKPNWLLDIVKRSLKRIFDKHSQLLWKPKLSDEIENILKDKDQ